MHFCWENRAKMPDWVADKQRRADKIRQAKAELEAEAKSASRACVTFRHLPK
jgi:hypothetical protein